MVTVKQTTANIWRLHEKGWWLVDPVNVFVKLDRRAVMGKGLAAQVVEKYPQTPSIYGELLLGWVRPGVEPGKQVKLTDLKQKELIQADFEHKIIFLPTKLMWSLDSDLDLIKMSLDAFKEWMKRYDNVQNIAIPHIGTGNGKLDWETQVRPLMRDFLESLEAQDRAKLTIVHPPEYLSAFHVE